MLCLCALPVATFVYLAENDRYWYFSVPLSGLLTTDNNSLLSFPLTKGCEATRNRVDIYSINVNQFSQWNWFPDDDSPLLFSPMISSPGTLAISDQCKGAGGSSWLGKVWRTPSQPAGFISWGGSAPPRCQGPLWYLEENWMNNRKKKKKRGGGEGVDGSSGHHGRSEMKDLDRLTEELAGSVLAVIWSHGRKQGLIQLAVWSSSLVLTSQLRIHLTPHWQQGLTDLSSYHWILGWGKRVKGRKKKVAAWVCACPLSPSPLLSLFHTQTLPLSPLSYLWLLPLLLLAAVKWRAITDPSSPFLPTLLKLN